MIIANGNGNQGCVGSWFNPCCHSNNSVLFQVISNNIANMLVVGSMVGPCKLSTTFSMFSMGTAMLGIPMLPSIQWVLIITIEVGMTLYVGLSYGSNGIQS